MFNDTDLISANKFINSILKIRESEYPANQLRLSSRCLTDGDINGGSFEYVFTLMRGNIYQID